MKLSLVVPCYNEEGNVERFFSETNRAFANNVDDYEFVFVDDGSTDSTYSKLESIYVSNPQSDIQVLSFSRNFGKEAALLQESTTQRAIGFVLSTPICNSAPRSFCKCLMSSDSTLPLTA